MQINNDVSREVERAKLQRRINSEFRIRSQAAEHNSICESASELKNSVEGAEAKLKTAIDNAPQDVKTSEKIFSFMFILIYISAFFLDYILLNQTALYIMSFAQDNILAWLGSYGIPLAILIFEIFICEKIVMEREEVRELRNGGLEENEISRSSLYFWIGAGICFLLVMPCLTIATQLAMNIDVADSIMQIIFGFQMIAISILAFIVHGVIIFGGTSAHRAKVIWLSKGSELLADRRNRLLRRKFNRIKSRVSRSFIDLSANINSHNDAYPGNNFRVGPFPAVTREITNTVMGYEAIESQNGPEGSTNENPSSNAGDEEPGAGSAEPGNDTDNSEDRQRRDDDSEVKP